ncbi:alpha/beta fold hydrolase [Acinetobacter baylyi]|uniref:alpha/beta fold hydrolase n=1 Tax=Acinetobacter baylyi TaxID=202950 RepID=UPI000EA3D45B|nr:alpha/beta hydrolase [Acinetobacter baylyi]
MPFYTMPDQEQLFVRRFGSGKPVVVLSGLGMQSWQWVPFLFSNTKGFEFIIPEWRGFGRSKECAIPEDLDSISSHWRDLEHLLKQLQLEKFAMIGYSMGATTAMHGMQYGSLSERLQAYLHIDQTPKIRVDNTWEYGLFGTRYKEFRRFLHLINELLQAYPNVTHIHELPETYRQELIETWLKFIEFQSSNRYSPMLFKVALKRPQLQKYLLPIQRLDYLRWYVQNYLNHREDYRNTLQQLECPTTFFIGKKSTLYPEKGQTLIASQLKNARHVYFENSGHTPLITEPKKFRHEIRRFLEDLNAA